MIELVSFRRCAVFGLFAATILKSYGEARAATIITAFNSSATENFDSYAGTAVSIPSNLTLVNTAAPGFGGTLDSAPGGGTAANQNSSYAIFFSTISSTDRAFDSRRSATTADPYNLSWSFQNQTGFDIPQFNLAWDVEQYSQGNRATKIDIDYSPNGAGTTTAGIVPTVGATTAVTASKGNATAVYLNPPTITHREATITLATPLADGQSIDFRWTWASEQTGANMNAHIGIDNLSVTAVPEPSTAFCGGLVLVSAGLARIVGRRRNFVAGSE